MKKFIFLYLFFFSLFFQLSYGQSDGEYGNEECVTECGDGTYWSEEEGGCIVAFYGDMDVDGYVGTNDLLGFLAIFGTYAQWNGGGGISLPIYGCQDPLACDFNDEANVSSINDCHYPSDYGWCNCAGDIDDACGNCGGDGSTCFQTCGDDAYYDGYGYATVQLGDDCWFAENCRFVPNGILNNLSDAVGSQPAYYVYDELSGYLYSGVPGANTTPLNYDTYGVLYNNPAIRNFNICPNEWHVSTELDWKELEMTLLGLTQAEYDATGWRGSNQGDILKDPSWGNGSTTPVGFNGLPGGAFVPPSNPGYAGYFTSLGSGGHWWSLNDPNLTSGDEDSPLDPNVVYEVILERRHINSSHSSIYRDTYYAASGLSARCVKTKYGCTDTGACNYDPNAAEEDGSCLYTSHTCDDGDPNTGLDVVDASCNCVGYILGCIDPVACNFDPLAQIELPVGTLCMYEGDICDNGDPSTINNTYDSSCNCTGGTQVFVCGNDDVNFDNYDYSTVLIVDQFGVEQCWFAENCRSFVNGLSLPSDPASTSIAMSYANGYTGTPNSSGGFDFSFQDAELANGYITYGALYNFPAVQTNQMCPSGWHVPTDIEWSSLEIALGANLSVAGNMGWSASPAITMKSASGLWPATAPYMPTNNSGMTIEPGGLLINYGVGSYFQQQSALAGFWTKTAGPGSVVAYARGFIVDDNRVERSLEGRETGYSVRCIQN